MRSETRNEPQDVKLRRRQISALMFGAAFAATKDVPAQEVPVGDAIRIGMPTAMTGINGPYGTEMARGMTAYFNSVNAQGGVNGRRLELILEDDGYDPVRTEANMKRMIARDKVFAFVATYGASAVATAKPVIEEARIPLIGPLTGSTPGQSNPGRYIFYTRAGYTRETQKIAEHLVTTGVRNFAVFYQSDNYGRSGLEGMASALKAFSIPLSAEATVAPNSEDDVQVTAAASRIAAARPDVVVIATLVKPVAKFIRAMKERKAFPVYYLLSPVSPELIYSELGADALGVGVSQVMPSPNSPAPFASGYRDMMRRFGEGKFSYYSLEAYLTGRVLVEALRRAGKNLTRARLVEELERMNDFDLGGFTISFSPSNHVGSKFVELTIIGANGKVVR